MRDSVVNNTHEHWDIVLEPKTSFFRLNLKDVWQYRDLMWLFVRRDFVAQYKQTILGPLWHVIQPLLTTLVFLFLFGSVAKIGTDEIEPILFYMSGIAIWNYFAACLTNTSTTFVTNASIFGKVYFPRLVIPLSIVISNIIRFGIQFGLLLIFMIWYAFKGVPIVITYYWLFIPVLVILMAGIGFGLGVIISSLTTKYRDMALLLTFAVQLGMYVTPIAYPFSFLETTKYQWLVGINPLSPIVEAFRYCLFSRATVSMSALLYSFIFMIVVVVTGMLIFNKVEKDFMDTV
ncbi:ABC transporter permease [Niastella caeni]|uniref:Transport permease protein n=1 Tax=Niastella caeni TaxID=2569763 RepID=A0A4S8I3H0_9BACT|nr:ABC transporter permease [Niastella caeni]THU41544.1 ABC transporter permease [Niastella caeni]